MHPDWQNALHRYCEAHSSPEPPLLTELTAWTWRNTINPRMLSGHLQGRTLALLAGLMRPQCILEIGTFTGYSTLCLLEGLAPGGLLHTVEADAEHAFKASGFISRHPRAAEVRQHTGDAMEVIPGLGISPDLVFVDADKRRYADYLDLCFPLLAAGGLMLFDNTLWSGRVLDEQDRQQDADTRAMHDFNEKAARLHGAEVLMLPLRDGLTLIRKL